MVWGSNPPNICGESDRQHKSPGSNRAKFTLHRQSLSSSIPVTVIENLLEKTNSRDFLRLAQKSPTKCYFVQELEYHDIHILLTCYFGTKPANSANQ